MNAGSEVGITHKYCTIQQCCSVSDLSVKINNPMIYERGLKNPSNLKNIILIIKIINTTKMNQSMTTIHDVIKN